MADGAGPPRTLEALIAAVAAGRLGPVVQDHRQAGPGRVFVAIRGHRVDARRFAPEAARAGCAAVVARGEAPDGWPYGACVWIRVGDDRRALSRLAAAQYAQPSRHLGVTAVTGTNGKTTVTYVLEAIWRAAGVPCGRIGTVEVKVGDRRYPAVLTTPDPLDLHRWLQRMHRQGVREVAMEASSHALAQRRIDDVAVDVAVLTNVRRDHLDYHRSHRAYRDAKGRLFTRVLARAGEDAAAVLPVGEAAAELFARRTPAREVWYGLLGDARAPRPAAVAAEALEPRRWGTRFLLHLPDASRRVDLPLAGAFNVRNALAAAAAAHARGLGVDAVATGLEAVAGAPGRVQVIYDGAFAILLDFAHNPDALAEVMAAARQLTAPAGRVLCVMGAEGEKDRGKRPLMGEAAGRHADVVWVTSDNPHGEDPGRIVAQVAAGARRSASAVVADPDRRRAIAAAVEALRAGDTLVVAGRGPERFQAVGGRRLRWSDEGAIRAALARRLAEQGETQPAPAAVAAATTVATAAGGFAPSTPNP
jgi:UDP-N-acetylmuramoyl-L-alanyl-D-glutamate--2,6-diaminopimelate ligase